MKSLKKFSQNQRSKARSGTSVVGRYPLNEAFNQSKEGRTRLCGKTTSHSRTLSQKDISTRLAFASAWTGRLNSETTHPPSPGSPRFLTHGIINRH